MERPKFDISRPIPGTTFELGGALWVYLRPSETDPIRLRFLDVANTRSRCYLPSELVALHKAGITFRVPVEAEASPFVNTEPDRPLTKRLIAILRDRLKIPPFSSYGDNVESIASARDKLTQGDMRLLVKEWEE